ncbi:MAG TPA: ribokinase [Dehalococcoidia bacterium]|nr:ribokinase [Dehalococcoidia bacterium]
MSVTDGTELPRRGEVLVLGSVNMDLIASVARHPRPGETVFGRDLRHALGGKGANQAVAAARMGAHVRQIARLGGDAFGDILRETLSSYGVRLLAKAGEPNQPSGVAIVAVAENGENMIVVIPGANARLAPTDIDPEAVAAADVILAQGEVPATAVAHALDLPRKAGRRTILNASPVTPEIRGLVGLHDIVVVNEHELCELSGVDPASVWRDGTPDTASIVGAIGRLRRDAGQVVIVTLGRWGVLAVGAGPPLLVPGHAVPVVDTTGAGDCFAGAFAAGLANGLSFAASLRLANAAAALSVQKPGAAPSMPSLAEVVAAGQPVERHWPSGGVAGRSP